MPIADAEWERIESAEGLITSVHTLLKTGASQAYTVDDFFRDVGPESPDEFELLNALLDAVDWWVSRHRSELLAELALEDEGFQGYAEKKMGRRDDEYIAYYRALMGRPDRASEKAPETVQTAPEGDLSLEPDRPTEQRPVQSPQ